MEPNSSAKVPATELSLEERKFAFDKELRLQEIAIKAREVSIRETELARSRWFNPTVIGLVAAASGLFGNLLVVLFSNVNSQRLEQFKAQSNLIVQAVGTGDPKSACRNLMSFIRLGLLDDPHGRLAQCETDLNAIPVLPSGSTYTPFLDTPAASAMAPVVNVTTKGENYHYDVSFTVPAFPREFAMKPINLITIYSYKLDASAKRSEDKDYSPIKGNWRTGDRVSIPIDIPRQYVDDTGHKTFLRFCIGAVEGCMPGPNIVLPQPVATP